VYKYKTFKFINKLSGMKIKIISFVLLYQRIIINSNIINLIQKKYFLKI